jgi:hypothetical protein
VVEVVQACHKHKFLHWSWSSTLQRHLILWIGKAWTAFYKLEGSPPSGEIGYKPSLWCWDQLSKALDFLQKRPRPRRPLATVPFPFSHWHPLGFAQKFTFWPPTSYWSGSTLCHAPIYAYDTLIVLRGGINGVRKLKDILHSFTAATGLQINYHKSNNLLQQCLTILGCQQESFPQNYLGLPLSSAKLLAAWQASLLNTMGSRPD